MILIWALMPNSNLFFNYLKTICIRIKKQTFTGNKYNQITLITIFLNFIFDKFTLTYTYFCIFNNSFKTNFFFVKIKF